jgi:hypothetical protein
VSAAPLDGTLSFAVDAPDGTQAALVHLGRDLRVVAGGQARTVAVPAAELGLGRSQVRLEIRDQAGALLVRGGAVTVTVTEPAPLPASPEPAATVRGVRVIPYDQESPGVVVAKGRLDGGWLADALGAERARRPVKAGWWFRSDSADLTRSRSAPCARCV